MELLLQVITGEIQKGNASLLLSESAAKHLNQTYLVALQRIRDIIHDDTLSDAECFSKIEAIICVLEDIGSSGGTRHDFG